MKNRAPDIGRLHAIMARLRSPQGCPWDLEQSHDSLKPYLIEEAYEVLEAIDADDPSELCEELGDLLLQIVFHARLGEEAEQFDLGDVIAAISDKMVRRHPHVFGEEDAADADAVRDRWEQIKVAEGRDLFSGTPQSLPALLRAQRIGEKAAGVGFDWRAADGVLAKVREELHELEEALATHDGEGAADPEGHVAAELGDLLFALSSLARHLGLTAEDSLRRATRRFERRFEVVRSLADERGLTLEDEDEATLDALWEAAKARLGA